MNDRMKAERDRAPEQASRPEPPVSEPIHDRASAGNGYLRLARGRQRVSALLQMQHAVGNRAVQRQVDHVQRGDEDEETPVRFPRSGFGGLIRVTMEQVMEHGPGVIDRVVEAWNASATSENRSNPRQRVLNFAWQLVTAARGSTGDTATSSSGGEAE